jgi:hypothetical protein
LPGSSLPSWPLQRLEGRPLLFPVPPEFRAHSYVRPIRISSEGLLYEVSAANAL